MTGRIDATDVEPRVTIDDLRHRADDVKSKAITEAKNAVDIVVGENSQRTLLVVAGVVLIAASIAFYLGTRAVRHPSIEDILGK